MGLLSGGFIIGRIFASRIFLRGEYYRDGLFPEWLIIGISWYFNTCHMDDKKQSSLSSHVVIKPLRVAILVIFTSIFTSCLVIVVKTSPKKHTTVIPACLFVFVFFHIGHQTPI